MKKIITVLAITAVLLCGGCRHSDSSGLRNEIKQLNRECPVSLGNVGVLESTRYDGERNTAVFTYAVNDDYIAVATLAKANTAQKTALASFLRGNEGGTRLLEELVRADASLEFVYRAMESRDSVSVELNADELRDISAEEIGAENDLSQLSSMIAVTNSLCPQECGSGLTLVSARIVEGYIVFHYEYDPTVSDFSPANMALLKTELTAGLREDLTDISGRNQLALMKACGTGVKYVFRPTTGEGQTTIVDIPAAEVASF